MRTLILTRGAPGCGKSHTLSNLGLYPYTISSDNIRLMVQSPVLTPDGSYTISQHNDRTVWALLFEVLEERMRHGELTVVDATHSKVEMINRYKRLCQSYRYRCYVMDFFPGVSMEECLKRNADRLPSYKVVPDDVIVNAYSRYETQPNPNWVTAFDPRNTVDVLSPIMTPLDYNKWDKIHVFGDIHSCFEPLKKFFELYPYNPDDMYIFTGDYFDRGIQPVEVFRFLQDMQSRNNVSLLEGNHEAKVLWDETRMSRTRMALVGAGVTDSEMRQFYRKLGQLAWFTFGDGNRRYFVNHGGVSAPPSVYVSADQLIYGVGKYEDDKAVHRAFERKMSIADFQIHGHRNINLEPMIDGNCVNLCDDIEHGGNLRVATILKTGIIQQHLIPNPVFASDVSVVTPETIQGLLESMRHNRFVNVKTLTGHPDIVSCNYNNDVQRNKRKAWSNPTTCMARGLFIRASTGEVVARAYPKFWTINEWDDMTLAKLQHRLVFPLTITRKENGYLGILGVDRQAGELLYLSRTSDTGWYADTFKSMLQPLLDEESMIHTLSQYNASVLFEVIHHDDPHIIEYSNDQLVLLDMVSNDVDFKQIDPTAYSNWLSICKSKAYLGLLKNWDEFLKYIEKDEQIEGWVFQDDTGFMFREKTKYYRFWKQIRGILQMFQGGKPVRTGGLLTPDHNKVYKFMVDLGRERLTGLSIIDVRKLYYNQGVQNG